MEWMAVRRHTTIFYTVRSCRGRVMVVQEVGAKEAGVFLCREDVRVRNAGDVNSLHTLYDWGATVTLVTHAAAAKMGLERKRQVAAAVAGLGGRCTMIDSYYMVPVVDGDGAVRALGMDHIATLSAADVAGDVVTRILQTEGFAEKLARPARDVEMLIGMDNQGWMPVPVESSQLASDNLRLMQSVLSPLCILMGSVRMPEQGRGTQGSNVGTPATVKQPGGRRLGVQPRGSMRAMMTMMLLMLAGLPECVAFRAFDCNSQSSQIEQYSYSTRSPAATLKRCTPSSGSSTERSCRSRRSDWCRSPGVRQRRRSRRRTAVGRVAWAPSDARSSMTQSPSSREIAGRRPRRGASSSMGRSTPSR